MSDNEGDVYKVMGVCVDVMKQAFYKKLSKKNYTFLIFCPSNFSRLF